jgi:ABC-type bacteriocin/lantibiotic exporter with double-glycine peptidase domain
MNIVYNLFSQYILGEKWNTIGIIIASFIINAIQTGGISFITANIINFIKDNKVDKTWTYLYFFIGFSIAVLVFHSIYKHLQYEFLTKLRHKIRTGIITEVLKINDENYNNMNFNKLTSPINRTASVMFYALNGVINYFLPNLTFFIIIMGYFLYQNTTFGIFFIITNAILLAYSAFIFYKLYKKDDDYETDIIKNDYELVDLLNNMDKIISRGQTKKEVDFLWKKSDKLVDLANELYRSSNWYVFIGIVFLYFILFCYLSYLIFIVFKKDMTVTIFITIFTILLLYKERMATFLQQIEDHVDFCVRVHQVIQHFNELKSHKPFHESTVYLSPDIGFKKIEFRNVSYKYEKNDKVVFQDKNLTIHTENKIIGITGLSGNGKSTFAKLLLKMYHPARGSIYIDDYDLESLDTEFIRKKITYVNQNSKLFDMKVIGNIFYGCNDTNVCKNHLNEIMKYPKIRELYKNIDFETKDSGSLGDNLSGGQRQVINVISGLINPSPILILDEPTNALDPALKKELIGLVRDFKKHTQCIFIITHDSEVFSLFNERIQI